MSSSQPTFNKFTKFHLNFLSGTIIELGSRQLNRLHSFNEIKSFLVIFRSHKYCSACNWVQINFNSSQLSAHASIGEEYPVFLISFIYILLEHIHGQILWALSDALHSLDHISHRRVSNVVILKQSFSVCIWFNELPTSPCINVARIKLKFINMSNKFLNWLRSHTRCDFIDKSTSVLMKINQIRFVNIFAGLQPTTVARWWWMEILTIWMVTSCRRISRKDGGRSVL